MKPGKDDVYRDIEANEALLTTGSYDSDIIGTDNSQLKGTNNMKPMFPNKPMMPVTNSTDDDITSIRSTEDDSSNPESSEEAELHRTTNCETMINLLKANVGTGILAMPDAFKNMGLMAGLVMMAILGFLCVHCQHILLGCGKDIGTRINKQSLSYADVIEYSIKLGPERIRRYSYVARQIVNVFLIVTQIGFCCVYFVFISTNISQVLTNYHIEHLSVHSLMAIILPFMIAFNFIKSLKALAPLSMLANLLLSVGLIIIFYGICQNLPPISSRPYLADYRTWPLFFGTAVYTFEGIGMVLPIENKMKNPADFRGLTGVLNTGMIIVACCFSGVGFYGYLKFGDDVYGSITLNLPPRHILYESVKIMFAVGVFITYGLMLYVPIQIMWPTLSRHIANPRLREIGSYAFRTLLVVLSFAIAELIPHLEIVISLVGAIGSSALALIFPPAIEIVFRYPNNYGRFKWILIKDILLCTFGIFGFFIGTYATIAKAWAMSGTHPKH